MPTRRPLEQVRRICLELPEAYEEETWGEATFRVRKKIFVMAGEGEGQASLSLKVGPGEQQPLLAQGEPYYMPAYVGTKGWVGVHLTAPELDWDELAELIADSYRLIAPKRLAAQVP